MNRQGGQMNRQEKMDKAGGVFTLVAGSISEVDKRTIFLQGNFSREISGRTHINTIRQQYHQVSSFHLVVLMTNNITVVSSQNFLAELSLQKTRLFFDPTNGSCNRADTAKGGSYPKLPCGFPLQEKWQIWDGKRKSCFSPSRIVTFLHLLYPWRGQKVTFFGKEVTKNFTSSKKYCRVRERHFLPKRVTGTGP